MLKVGNDERTASPPFRVADDAISTAQKIFMEKGEPPQRGGGRPSLSFNTPTVEPLTLMQGAPPREEAGAPSFPSTPNR